MNAVCDFVISALPWVAIGMFTAVECVRFTGGTMDDEKKQWFDLIGLVPVICFLISAVMDMSSGNSSRGTVWLMLGIMVLATGYAAREKKEEE